MIGSEENENKNENENENEKKSRKEIWKITNSS